MLYRETSDGNIEPFTIDQLASGEVTYPSDTDRRVAKDEVAVSTDEQESRQVSVNVSTVFLAVDHNYGPHRNPVLYETMIFGGWDRLNEKQWRYTTREKAVAGHGHIVALLSHNLLDYLDDFGPFVDPAR